MSRNDKRVSTPRGAAATAEAMDEACFLSELRLAVEGARTSAEERLRNLPEWGERMKRLHARYAGGSPSQA